MLGSGHAAAEPRHPSVLLDELEVTTLRQQLAEPGWKRDCYRRARDSSGAKPGCGVRANANLWLRRKIEIPAYGGHFHNFVCVEGDRLELPNDQRFVPGPYKCPKCGRQYSGERYEGALRRMAHVWLAQAALDLALVSAIEQKADYADKAAEILLKYAAAYPGPHTSADSGGMIYQSLDEAMWVIPLAQAYDLICERLGAAERARIETILRTVARGIQNCGTVGNWGSWHLSAVGVVGYAVGDEELVNWAIKRFKQQIAEQLGDDGLWPESVHTYHYYPLLAFLNFAEAAWHAGVDLYHWEARPGKSLLAMLSVPLAYAYPDLRLPAINDGWFEAFVPADVYELAYYRTHDPRFGWVLARGYKPGISPGGTVPSTSPAGRREGLYAFLFGQEIPREVVPPSAASINFPVLGICVLRSTNGAMMTFHYGPFLGHGHHDKMGITLFANQKLWFADYGTPAYGAAILPWYQSALAHNLIVVDGRNEARTRENHANLWLGGSDLEAVQSETREAYPGVVYTRTVVRVGEYFVLSDRLESTNQHTYDFYLHGEGKLSLDGPKGKTESIASPVRWVTGLTARSPVASVSGHWADGRKGVAFWIGGLPPASSPPLEETAGKGRSSSYQPSTINYQLNGPGQIEPITGQCPAESGARQVPLLIARQRGRAAQFVTVLFPYQRRPDDNVRWQGQQLVITHGDARDTLSLPAFGLRPIVQKQSGADLEPAVTPHRQRTSPER